MINNWPCRNSIPGKTVSVRWAAARMEFLFLHACGSCSWPITRPLSPAVDRSSWAKIAIPKTKIVTSVIRKRSEVYGCGYECT